MGRRRVIRRRSGERIEDSEFALMRQRLTRGEISRTEWLKYLRKRKELLAEKGVTRVKGGRIPIEEKYDIPREVFWELYIKHDKNMEAIARALTSWIIRHRGDYLTKKELSKLKVRPVSSKTVRRAFQERIKYPPAGWTPYKVKKTFEESILIPKLESEYFKSKDPKTGKIKLTDRGRGIYNFARKVTLYLGKLPEEWTKADFQKLYKTPVITYKDLKTGETVEYTIFDPETGKLSYQHGYHLRMIMKLLGHSDWPEERWADSKHGAPKKRKGKKLTHYIRDEQMPAVIDAFEDIDTLVYAKIQMECGARYSSMALIKPSEIDPNLNAIITYEPKVKQTVTRYFQPETMELLLDYVRTRGIKPDQYIFLPKKTKSQRWYNERLKKVGEKAGLPFELTTHTLKHTFVSQAGYHGVPMDIVSKQSGTDPGTLREFYAGIEQKAFQHHIQGRRIDIKPYYQFLKELQPLWRYKYDYLKRKELGL